MTITGLFALSTSSGTGALTLAAPTDSNRQTIPDGTHYYTIATRPTYANPYPTRWETGKGVVSGSGTVLTRTAGNVTEANAPGSGTNPQTGVLANLPAGGTYVVFITDPKLRGQTGGRITINADGEIIFDDAGLGEGSTPGAHAASHATAGTDAITPGAIGAATAAALTAHTGATSSAHPASAIAGLGGAATLNVGTAAGMVAAGNDARIIAAKAATQHFTSANMGSWTPKIAVGGTEIAGAAYMVREGRFFAIEHEYAGRVVVGNFRIILTAGTVSGALLEILGLPYNAGSGNGSIALASVAIDSTLVAMRVANDSTLLRSEATLSCGPGNDIKGFFIYMPFGSNTTLSPGSAFF